MTPLLSSVLLLFSIFSVAHARVGGQAAARSAGTAAALSNLTTKSKSGAPFAKEMMYTDNSLCRQNYCTNPVFPGINDLPRLESLPGGWQCATTDMVKDHMDFCKDAIVYDPALPSPATQATAVDVLVRAQEDAAQTMFVYHLNGMGYEHWDYQTPSESDNDCIKSIWKMVCFTYFPRAQAGCKTGERSLYLRPCKSCCQNYIKQCGIECCDESVACTFTHTGHDENGQIQLLSTGYVDAEGPSARCTGGARRSIGSPLAILLAIFGFHWAMSSEDGRPSDSRCCQVSSRQFALFVLIGILALSLQGCDNPIPTHSVGNWRTKANYLSEFRFVPPGLNEDRAVLNSCAQRDTPVSSQCSGRGYCRGFSKTFVATDPDSQPLAFCQCERDWADPECGTKRKSQATTFCWSLFLGWLGADYFYLGYPLWGLAKLFTLGGLGFWWLIDIIRTASGPVYAVKYRTANDLPHWAAILAILALFMLCGFLAAIETYLIYRRKKRDDLARLQQSEEMQHYKETKHHLAPSGSRLDGPRLGREFANANFAGSPGFSGYGATLPRPLNAQHYPEPTSGPGGANGYHGANPNVTSYAQSQMDYPAGPYGPAGIPGQGSPTPPSQDYGSMNAHH